MKKIKNKPLTVKDSMEKINLLANAVNHLNQEIVELKQIIQFLAQHTHTHPDAPKLGEVKDPHGSL